MIRAMGGTMQAQPFGSFGARPDDFSRTEFYAFFHLALEDPAASPAPGDIIRHRSTGQFRASVAVDILPGPTGETTRIALALRDSFVTEPATSPFARDIVRSFIRDG